MVVCNAGQAPNRCPSSIANAKADLQGIGDILYLSNRALEVIVFERNVNYTGTSIYNVSRRE